MIQNNVTIICLQTANPLGWWHHVWERLSSSHDQYGSSNPQHRHKILDCTYSHCSLMPGGIKRDLNLETWRNCVQYSYMSNFATKYTNLACSWNCQLPWVFTAPANHHLKPSRLDGVGLSWCNRRISLKSCDEIQRWYTAYEMTY